MHGLVESVPGARWIGKLRSHTFQRRLRRWSISRSRPAACHPGSVCLCPEAEHPDLLRCTFFYFRRQWRLHAQSLAARSMRCIQMCDLSFYTKASFNGNPGSEGANLIDSCLLPCLKSHHMATRSCISVSLRLGRLFWYNHQSCAVYALLVFLVSSFSSPYASHSTHITS